MLVSITIAMQDARYSDKGRELGILNDKKDEPAGLNRSMTDTCHANLKLLHLHTFNPYSNSKTVTIYLRDKY